MDCKQCKSNIDAFFSTPSASEEQLRKMHAALAHMTAGTTVKKHNVSCRPCWDYYQEQQRVHVGG